MELTQPKVFKIVNTTRNDLNTILWLFKQAMKLQGRNGYKVWEAIDQTGLERDIDKGLQYKIVQDNNITCVFSIQFNDPFIWGEKDRDHAIYLHRIVVNPNFKGLKQFQKVLDWACNFALQHHLQFVRMDTWADNSKIIEYYKSFGFEFIENYQTTNEMELPIQNRNLNVALLQLKLDNNLHKRR
ncbi:MAG TPA: GNAT family N-acetyltransferase [Ginsengibacter sp.]|nr:GNAT family N-acetyltransferase [Ginsengibacter sp.]